MNLLVITNGIAAAGSLAESAGIVAQSDRVGAVGRIMQDAMATFFWYQFAKGAGNAGWRIFAAPSLLLSMSSPGVFILKKLGYQPAEKAAPVHHIVMQISNAIFALLSAQAFAQQPMQMSALQLGALANVLPVLLSRFNGLC